MSRRFRPAVLPTIATFAAIALFVAAGIWQYGRMVAKERLGAQLEAATRKAPVELPNTGDWERWRFRAVVIGGTFDAAQQILLDNKVRGGRAGYDVVAPMSLPDGRAVLVDRGWVAAGETRAQLPNVAPPAGMVWVQGRINTPPTNYLELRSETVRGPVWQNLDLARYTASTGMQVLPIIVEQTVAVDRNDNLVRAWPAPDLGADGHRIYMAQWFLFAALAAGLWLYFAWRKQ